jgi:hypothetical protein
LTGASFFTNYSSLTNAKGFHHANELDWLRSKATHLQTETMTVSAEEATSAGCAPGVYTIERYGFTRTVPFRMAKALSGSKLISTESESEVLHLGTGYRGGEGKCRYYRTT